MKNEKCVYTELKKRQKKIAITTKRKMNEIWRGCKRARGERAS